MKMFIYMISVVAVLCPLAGAFAQPIDEVTLEGVQEVEKNDFPEPIDKITPEVVKAAIGPQAYVKDIVNKIVGVTTDFYDPTKEVPFKKTMKAKIAVRFFNNRAIVVLPEYFEQYLPNSDSFFTSPESAITGLKIIENFLESQLASPVYPPYNEDWVVCKETMKRLLDRLELD